MRKLPAVTLALLIGCAACEPAAVEQDAVAPSAVEHGGLSSIVDFPVGVAVPADPWENSLLTSPGRQAITERHFDSITAENAMKMQYLHPSPGYYEFEAADALVDYAAEHGMIVHGHALVWHNQAPDWVNEMEGSADAFRAVLDDHVRTVASHFAGRVESWDVVNEAFTDDHPSGYRDTTWYRNIGEGYIEQAFIAAREADPDADLYYNDYNISGADGMDKLDRVLVMVDDFLDRGIPIDGIGFQMHIDLENPSLSDMRTSFEQVVERGLKVRISELDVSVNNDEALTELTDEVASVQAQRYADIAGIYQQVVPPALRGGITVWGITDGDSWIPGFRERPDWPLLFNADFTDKPALEGLAAGLAAGNSVAQFEWFEYTGNDEVFATPLQDDEYLNPVVAGFYPDPSIVRHGDDYYLVHSSFAYLPGVPVLHSRNLADWRTVGHALTRPSQPSFEGQGVSRGIFAPTIRFHDGLFYMITTAVDVGGNFFVTASDPSGPWSDPVWLPEIDGIDPDIFFDTDGRTYILHNGPPEGEPLYDGHRAIWIWEYDLAGKLVIPDSGRVIVNGGVNLADEPIWIEAPHLFRKDGWYYLICAEGGTGYNHSEVVFRTRNLDDPFVPYDKNPILTQRDLERSRPDPVTTAGHADFVETPDGDWWAVFLGTRTYDEIYYNFGRETFLLPVSWQDGWPEILDTGKRIPYRSPRPDIDATTPGPNVLTGNFNWQDDFAGKALDLHWQRLRSYDDSWFSLDGGKLQMMPRAAGLDSLSQPAFLGRRQQHLRYSASVRLEVPDTGISAGIAAFQNETAWFFLAASRSGNDAVVYLEEAANSKPGFHGQPLTLENSDPVIDLRIAGDRGQIRFYYRSGDGDWTPFAENLDGKVLSTEVAGGFVGTMLGPHARFDLPGKHW